MSILFASGWHLRFMDRDAALYALGIGACARDALDKNDLKYVYHQDGLQSIQVLQI